MGGRTFLYERQIEMLNKLIQHLCDSRDFFQNAVRCIRFDGDLSIEEYHAIRVKAVASAQETIVRGRLLVPADLVDLCEFFFRRISQGLADFALAQEPMVANGWQRATFWDNAATSANNDLPAILEKIEEAARNLVHTSSPVS